MATCYSTTNSQAELCVVTALATVLIDQKKVLFPTAWDFNGERLPPGRALRAAKCAPGRH
jgi:hypothetical protein